MGGKAYIKMAVIMALSMACLMPFVLVSGQGPMSSPSPSPSLSLNPSPLADDDTPRCWAAILGCWGKSFNQTTLLDVTNPAFDLGKALCCPLLQQVVNDETDCFCSISPFLPDDPRVAPNLDLVLTSCKISGSIESICEGSSAATRVGPITSMALLLVGLMFF